MNHKTIKNFYYIVDFDECCAKGYPGHRYVVWGIPGLWKGLTETKISNFICYPYFKQEDIDLVIKHTGNAYVKFIKPITKKELELLYIEEKLRKL
jgi:hypothetical protein